VKKINDLLVTSKKLINNIAGLVKIVHGRIVALGTAV
jgi:ribosomal protein S17E